MQIKSVLCPHCQVVLDVKNSKNETLKTIYCPSCKALLHVKFNPEPEPAPKPQPAPMTAQTFYVPKRATNDQNGATILGGINNGKTILQTPCKHTSKAMLTFRGSQYPLDNGCNIIGRKAMTSQATVQIATDDRYMSRQHALITVTPLPDGTLKAVLSNYQNKNETMVNGKSVETSDAIRLMDGNSITMGNTTVTFKLS